MSIEQKRLQKKDTKTIKLNMPPIVYDRLKEESKRRGLSMSWMVVQSLCVSLRITQKDIDESRGYELPPVGERKKGWYPKRKEVKK